ncbi:Uma2 family endonuclease [soil metagenome]
MATAQKPRVETVDPGQRIVLQGMSWGLYEALLEENQTRHIFLTYDRGKLEFMSPSFRHEIYAHLIGVMIGVLAEELEIPIKCGRTTTFRRRELNKGLEPDECFWIGNEPRMRGKLDYDPATDPPPNLAIEIEVSRRALDRMGIYAALGVPEIWRCDGQTLTIHHRQADGSYSVVPRSPSLPMLPPEDVLRFLALYETRDETSWKRAFRDWVRAEVLPQVDPNEGQRPFA